MLRQFFFFLLINNIDNHVRTYTQNAVLLAVITAIFSCVFTVYDDGVIKCLLYSFIQKELSQQSHNTNGMPNAE